MSIGELIMHLNRLENAKPARNGTDEPPKRSKFDNGNVIDVDPFDATLDRLDREKKRAPEISSASADNPPKTP